MIRVFSSPEEYIDCLTSLPMNSEEAVCTTFIPSAFFPRDAIQIFFERHAPLTLPSAVTASLWLYGEKLRRSLQDGSCVLCIERAAVSALIADGRVHEASPDFEVGFAARSHALSLMGDFAERGSLFLVREPIPFVFRLHSPASVLIDVTRNTSAQRVQGLLLQDGPTFEAFHSELRRLHEKADREDLGLPLAYELRAVASRVRSGQPHGWRP